MALADDVARLTAILVRQHQDGTAERLRYTAFGLGHDAIGQLAKACGTSPSVLRAWEDGAATPTTQEALAWLSLLYERQPKSLAATVRHPAGEAT